METPLRQSVPYAVAGAMSFKKPELLESVKKLQKAPRFEYNGDGRIVGVTMAEQKRGSRKEVNAEREKLGKKLVQVLFLHQFQRTPCPHLLRTGGPLLSIG